MGVTGQPNGASCVAMQPGQSQPMQTSFGMLAASYTVTQALNPNGTVVYTANVPIQFVPEPGLRDRNGTIQAIRDFTNQCLAMASARMMGPKGEMLRIVLNDGPGGKQVVVTDRELPYGQGHAQRVTIHESWQCPQIVHEAMHWVGLVDGYLDGSKVYDCRAQGPGDALTVAPDMAYARVGLAMARPMVAPGAAPFRIVEPLAPPADGKSLLYPGEFNAIVTPHCGASERYAMCSANAYRNSAKHGCQQIPKDCYTNPSSWYVTPGRI